MIIFSHLLYVVFVLVLFEKTWFTEWRENVILIWFYHLCLCLYDDTWWWYTFVSTLKCTSIVGELGAGFEADDNCDAMKQYSVFRWVGVGCLEKLATFTTWRKPYLLRYLFYLFTFICCVCVSQWIIVWSVFCCVFVAYSIKICFLFTLFSEWG